MSEVIKREAVNGAEGEGVEVARLFPVNGFMNYDPFVLWDYFTVPPSAGFPDHPHRGFEGITYVFEGSMQHKDNLGNESTVTPGGLQRFTAGRGIVHSEMPSQGETTRGIQLWVNLSGAQKQVDPNYQQVDTHAVLVTKLAAGSVRELIGQDTELKLKTAVRYLDVQLDAGGQFEEVMPDGYRGLVFMIDGQADINGQRLLANNALFFEANAVVNAIADEPCRFMVCFGRPHGEPIRQHGPYVD